MRRRPLPPRPRSRPPAGALADRLDLGVELIHVVGPGTPPASGSGTAAVRAVTEEYLDLPGMAVRVETGLISGVLAEASRRALLLVIGTRGEGALRQALLGSVSAKLTRDPLSPVVVVPPAAADADPPFDGQTIVCGVRDERDSAPAHAAARLASDLGLTLTLAHVLSPPAIPVSAAGGAPPASMLRPTAHEFEAARHTLGAIARSIGIDIPVDVQLEVLDGPPGPHLDRLAAARGAAMLAVGACDQSRSRARSPAPRHGTSCATAPDRSSSARARSGSPEHAGERPARPSAWRPDLLNRKERDGPPARPPNLDPVSAGSRAPSGDIPAHERGLQLDPRRVRRPRRTRADDSGSAPERRLSRRNGRVRRHAPHHRRARRPALRGDHARCDDTSQCPGDAPAPAS